MIRLLVLTILVFMHAVTASPNVDLPKNLPRSQTRVSRRSGTSYIPKVKADFAPGVDSALGKLNGRGVLPAVPGPNVEQEIPASLLPDPMHARFIKDADYASSDAPPSLGNSVVANASPQNSPTMPAPTQVNQS